MKRWRIEWRGKRFFVLGFTGGCYGAITSSLPPLSLILPGVLQWLDAWLAVCVDIEFCFARCWQEQCWRGFAPYVGGRFSVENVFFRGAGLHFNVNSDENVCGGNKSPAGKNFLGNFLSLRWLFPFFSAFRQEICPFFCGWIGFFDFNMIFFLRCGRNG